jgi:hypothetical protein
MVETAQASETGLTAVLLGYHVKEVLYAEKDRGFCAGNISTRENSLGDYTT